MGLLDEKDLHQTGTTVGIEAEQEINYYLTQFFIGHGYFWSYLKKSEKAVTGMPLLFESNHDANHTFFDL